MGLMTNTATYSPSKNQGKEIILSGMVYPTYLSAALE